MTSGKLLQILFYIVFGIQFVLLILMLSGNCKLIDLVFPNMC